MELLIGQALLTFDGAVVEGFGVSSTSVGRLHVAVLDRVEISAKKRGGAAIEFFTIWGGCKLRVDFPSEMEPQVEHFAIEVRKVLAASGRG